MNISGFAPVLKIFGYIFFSLHFAAHIIRFSSFRWGRWGGFQSGVNTQKGLGVFLVKSNNFPFVILPKEYGEARKYSPEANPPSPE